MGNDGGSIPDRRDLVRSKPKAEQADKANQTRARWFFCALSKKPLQEPIVSDALGKLYNKDALLEFLLDRGAYGDGEEIAGHIRSLKDVTTLALTPVPASRAKESEDAPKFLCPLTRKEMTGHVPFVYITRCGCVLSQAGFKALSSSSSPPPRSASPSSSSSSTTPPPATTEGQDAKQLDLCPQCGKKFDKATDVRTINPGVEEEERMRDAMIAARPAKGKKRKAATAVAASAGEDGEGEVVPKLRKVDAADIAKAAKAEREKERVGPKKPTAGAAAVPGGHAQAHSNLSAAVQTSLAMEEAKRKAGMSDAVRSLYRDKNTARKETFMTMGTFTRYA